MLEYKLSEILRKPALLADTPEEAIDALIQKYPYAQLLYIIKARKAILSGESADTVLHLLSLHGCDRRFLLRSLHKYPGERPVKEPVVHSNPEQGPAEADVERGQADELFEAFDYYENLELNTLISDWDEAQELEDWSFELDIALIDLDNELDLFDMLELDEDEPEGDTETELIDLDEIPIVKVDPEVELIDNLDEHEAPNEVSDTPLLTVSDLLDEDEAEDISDATPDAGSIDSSRDDIPESRGDMLEREDMYEAIEDKKNDIEARMVNEEKEDPRDFVSWLHSLPGTGGSVEGLGEGKFEYDEDDDAIGRKEKKKGNKKKKKKKKKRDEEVEELFEESLQLDDDILSESLADLLAHHGHRKKAKKMYKKLRLKFPEKSDYFAAKIKKLKEE